MLISERPEDCEVTRQVARHRAHVLCSLTAQPPSPDGDDAARQMHGAIAYLKKSYPRHVAGSPVHLATSPRFASAGLRMLLREPQVFAYSYLQGLDPNELTSTIVSAIQGKGGRILAVSDEFSPRVQLIARAAGRGGMTLMRIPPEQGVQGAFTHFQTVDPRFDSDRTPPRKAK